MSAVKAFLNENEIKGKTVLCAVSGGVDSVVLLSILNELKEEFELDVKVVHLNHNWRGVEALEDLEFVCNLAQKYNFEYYTETLENDLKKTENDAREARYAFFERALKKFNADVCFLAHNKNDNVETLIYRIIKGTGVFGLSSIPSVRMPYYRPLLEFSRTEIETYAKQNRLKFRIDKSNDDTKYKRNFIRQKIIPDMLSINENALNSIASLIKLAGEHNDLIDDYIDSVEEKIFNQADKNWFYDRPSIVQDRFLALSEALQREILSRYFMGILKNRDYKTILKIQNFIRENKNSTLSINRDAFLKVKNNCAFIYRREQNKDKKYGKKDERA